MRLCIAVRTAAAAATGLLALGTASADCQRLVAGNNPAAPNSFTLDFGDFGGTRSANISYAEVTLEACADTGSARFLDYYQEVAPLILPDGTSTGDLTILISQSQPVSYDAQTGLFETSDLYEIHFAGDLSNYGIASPFVLPDNSQGRVTFQSAGDGTVDMQWQGASALPNPFAPGEFIPFQYTCAVNLVFAVDQGCPSGGGGCDAGDVDGNCQVDLADLSTLVGNFGASGPRIRPAHGDTNHDRSVDLQDLATVLSQFGNSCN